MSEYGVLKCRKFVASGRVKLWCDVLCVTLQQTNFWERPLHDTNVKYCIRTPPPCFLSLVMLYVFLTSLFSVDALALCHVYFTSWHRLSYVMPSVGDVCHNFDNDIFYIMSLNVLQHVWLWSFRIQEMVASSGRLWCAVLPETLQQTLLRKTLSSRES